MNRITTREASEMLGLSPQALRCWISSNTCPFGQVVREAKSRPGRNTYYICKERLMAYLNNDNAPK